MLEFSSPIPLIFHCPHFHLHSCGIVNMNVHRYDVWRVSNHHSVSLDLDVLQGCLTMLHLVFLALVLACAESLILIKWSNDPALFAWLPVLLLWWCWKTGVGRMEVQLQTYRNLNVHVSCDWRQPTLVEFIFPGTDKSDGGRSTAAVCFSWPS